MSFYESARLSQAIEELDKKLSEILAKLAKIEAILAPRPPMADLHPELLDQLKKEPPIPGGILRIDGKPSGKFKK